MSKVILDLFRACGAQELSDITWECRQQFDNSVTEEKVLRALAGLLNYRKVRTDGTYWGLPSDF